MTVPGREDAAVREVRGQQLWWKWLSLLLLLLLLVPLLLHQPVPQELAVLLQLLLPQLPPLLLLPLLPVVDLALLLLLLLLHCLVLVMALYAAANDLRRQLQGSLWVDFSVAP